MKLSIEGIKTLVILGLVVVIMFLTQCGGDEEPKEKIVTKTTIIRGKTDTVKFTIKEPIYVKVNVPTPVYIQNPIDTTTFLSRYTTNIDDSLINGEISSVVDGKLLEQELKYIPKFPKYINRVDTLIVNNEVQPTMRNHISLGMELGGSATSFNISPKVSFHSKHGYSFGYRYGLLDKTHNLSIEKVLHLHKKS